MQDDLANNLVTNYIQAAMHDLMQAARYDIQVYTK